MYGYRLLVLVSYPGYSLCVAICRECVIPSVHGITYGRLNHVILGYYDILSVHVFGNSQRFIEHVVGVRCTVRSEANIKADYVLTKLKNLKRSFAIMHSSSYIPMQS